MCLISVVDLCMFEKHAKYLFWQCPRIGTENQKMIDVSHAICHDMTASVKTESFFYTTALFQTLLTRTFPSAVLRYAS